MLDLDKYDKEALDTDKWYRAMAILTEAKKNDIELLKVLLAGRKLPKLADVDDYFVGVKELSRQTGITVYYLRQVARKICDKYNDIITDGYAKWGFEDADKAAEYIECGGLAKNLAGDQEEFKSRIAEYIGSKEWKAMEAQRRRYYKQIVSQKRKTVVEYYDEPLSNFDYRTFWKIGDNGKKDQRTRYILMQFYRHHISEYVKLVPYGAPKDARSLATFPISAGLVMTVRRMYPTVVENMEEIVSR